MTTAIPFTKTLIEDILGQILIARHTMGWWKKRHALIVTGLCLAFLLGCSDSFSSTTSNPEDTAPADKAPTDSTPPGANGVKGNIQKGPFINGSSITIQELDDSLNPTGTQFTTETTNDLGAFNLGSAIGSRFVEIIADGFYFDEIANNLSQAQLTLRTISDLNQGTDIKINLLTSLAKARIRKLVGEGATFSDAQEQAEAEVLGIFNIQAAPEANFDQMDISQTGDANAMLLAASAILLQAAHNRNPGAVAAELSSLLSAISIDLEPDGTLESTTLGAGINDASISLDLASVSQNLVARLASLGLQGSIPPFEDFVDSDGDGLLNRDDPRIRSWLPSPSLAIARQQFVTVELNGLIYAMGGVISGPGTVLDTVSCFDPVASEWTTRPSMPHARYRFYAGAVNGKIYVFGGSGAGVENVVDVYEPTSNQWSTLSTPMPSSRGDLNGAVLGNKIYLIGGQPILTVDEYEPASDSWRTFSSTTNGREAFAVAAVANEIFILGGWSDGLSSVLPTVESFDPANDTFTSLLDLPRALQAVTSVSLNGRIYTFGGSISGGGGSNITRDVHVYDPSQGVWTTASQMPTARYKASSSVVGNLIFLFGGEGPSDEDLPLVENFDPSNE